MKFEAEKDEELGFSFEVKLGHIFVTKKAMKAQFILNHKDIRCLKEAIKEYEIPSLCESNNQQTNQTVEQERGDISTLAPIIAQGVGKVKTVDEPSDESRAPEKDDAVSRIDEGSDICEYRQEDLCECEHCYANHKEGMGCWVQGCNCKQFRKKSLHAPGEVCECGHKDYVHYYGKDGIPCGVVDCECKQFSKKSKSETNNQDASISNEEGNESLTSRSKTGSTPDTSKSKESKIADELNKDYPKTKNSEQEKGK